MVYDSVFEEPPAIRFRIHAFGSVRSDRVSACAGIERRLI